MRAAAAGLLALLALAGCGRGGDDPATVTAPEAAPTATPTAGSGPPAPVTSPPAAGATAPPSTPAPATALPPPPVRAAAEGDVDGDGRTDDVRVTDSTVTVVLTGGGTVSAPVVADAPAVLRGVTDVDRDGRAEVFVRTAQGSSTTFLTPYRYDGRTLRPLLLGAEPVRLGAGGSVTHGDGFACTPAGRLVVSQAETPDGGTYTVRTTTYRIVGDRLVQAGSTTATTQGSDPRVGGAYAVSCGSVEADG